MTSSRLNMPITRLSLVTGSTANISSIESSFAGAGAQKGSSLRSLRRIFYHNLFSHQCLEQNEASFKPPNFGFWVKLNACLLKVLFLPAGAARPLKQPSRMRQFWMPFISTL